GDLMAWPIVTIHTVHPTALAFCELLGRHTVRHVLPEGAESIFDANPGDHLALVVRRDVFDLVRQVHVPVDASRNSQPLASAADVHLQCRDRLGVRFVLRVLVDLAHLVAVKLLGPMAPLARLASWPQGSGRLGNRPWITTADDVNQLADA